jgi:hypothetical protein
MIDKREEEHGKHSNTIASREDSQKSKQFDLLNVCE